MNKLLIEASCVVDGVEYHAVTAPHSRCGGCAAFTPQVNTHLCGSLQPCVEGERADRSTVIWVRAE